MEWAKLPISVDELQDKVAAQREPFRKCELLPGVTDLLNNLSKRITTPVYLAIASSGDRDFFELKTERLRDVLSAIPDNFRIFGNDPSMFQCEGKPAPDIFLQALARINDSLGPGEEQITPEECLVFEDSTAGVEAGRAAGMRVVWVPHQGCLEVYRGREETVLGAMLDGKGNETGVLISNENEDGGNTLPLSKDGRAELVLSLADFPYDHYGLQLQH